MKGKPKKITAPRYIVEAVQMLRPPEDITVSEWAEKHRRLDNTTSAIPGPWSNTVTPYLTGIMDEFNNPTTEEIVFVKPTQVGGTEAMLNCMGYCIDQDPAPMMVVYPTDQLAKRTASTRLQEGLIKLSDTLSKKYNEDSSWDQLMFDGMFLIVVGSNSPSKLASTPCKYLFLDETDKYPGASKKEADPISLARERTKTFRDRKIVMASTPTLKTGHIWKAMEGADAEKHFFVPCPHCGEYIELKFAQIKFPDDEKMTYADRAEFANYVCQECGKVIRDADKPMMLNRGEWRDVRSSAKLATKVAFWMNTLYSPFVRFSEVAKEFLGTKDNPELFQNFVNSWLAEPWEETKLRTSADLVLERQTEVEPYVLPENTLLLTGGVDVQETSLYWTIRAFGKYLTSQNVAHGQAFSFQEIEKIMNAEYVTESGKKKLVNLCLVDSGDQTDAVYDFVSYNAEWALPVKGSSKEMESYYKISKVNKTDSKAYGMQLVIVDGGKYKDMIASRMRRENGTGSWMVYKGCDREYAEQVTAEHKINVRNGNGKTVLRWVKKTTHADNHYLDAEVYALAAADMLGARMIHLKAEEEEIPEKKEPEKETTPEEEWIRKNEGWL